ncbi:SR-related and CTD-associated factor 8-like isoform X2 [Polyodon spathula]|uniref:SR-related and CTD-associated factor 8-like isoform X2 n=1 Tax=Polyodon spathula TaxID=7913 RepID=UPI001B7E6CF5|nr:SR-related and CTD-associated factor 8-like isoform X2 [Polyodon spathula]
MEAVKAFNSELYSLNDYKPPISKAKMTQITKLAIKAIKFYKHVVQSVEKFVQKCKPEYKVPGLYVIDSIVRQSRHQFGQEKDVFAPRFSKNIISTFQNLYRCPSDDKVLTEKSKIVRVLNLWQKNNVFKSDIIQPLLDMAAGLPPPNLTPVIASTAATVSNNTPGTPVTPATPANIVQGLPDSWASQISNTDTIAAVAQLLQSPQGQQLQQLVQTLQMQQQKPQPSLLQALDAGLVVQLQALTAQLTAAAAAASTLNPLEQRVSFNKLLERFDFGEESEHTESIKDAPSSQLPSVTESINNSIFHQLAEQLQQQNLEQFQKQLLEHHHHHHHQQQQQQTISLESQEGVFGSENSATPSQGSCQQQLLETDTKLDDSIDNQQQDMEIDEGQEMADGDIFEPEEPQLVESRSRTRSKSRSRSPRKRRSRSRSGSRKRKHRKRSRSRSRERKRKFSRSYSSERQAREQEKERQKKGLPPIRSKTLSVCSTTLWVGQVDKKATQQDLTNLFEEFGQIESINMIPPRGCAYICMVHRQDAYRARQKLSTGSCKIGSKVIKIAWALNKGVKQEYKQLWDVDLGVTYIPWEKVKIDNLDDFAEGGMIDQETVNSEWEAARSYDSARESLTQSAAVDTSTVITTQADAYTQPVTMLPVQMPVAQGVPAVSLMPPSYPVTMAMPPPGFGHLPPFLRAGFNASQPPPGYMPPPVLQSAVGPGIHAIPTSLVQPSVSAAQENAKDPTYGSLVPSVNTVPGTFISHSIPRGGDYNQSQQVGHSELDDKGSQVAENRTDNKTAQEILSDARSSVGLLGMHPSATSLHHPNIHGQRMPGLLPLDIRPGMLPPSPGARFSMLMQPGMPPQPNMPPTSMLDPSLQARLRGPFPPVDNFTRPERPFGSLGNQADNSVGKPDDRMPAGNDSIQQECDQDYRFPPVEKRESLLRPPVEQSDNINRPSLLDGRDGLRGPPGEGRENLGRRQSLSGFRPESRWGPPRGDFDEREHRGMPFGSPKGFSDDRPGPGNFRFDGRGGPTWNRGFEPDVHRDFDDRRHHWERQRDRDDRDLDFRREMNGSRFARERDREPWTAPSAPPQAFKFFEGAAESQKRDKPPQVNGDEMDIEQDQNRPELAEQEASPEDVDNEKKNEPETGVDKQPVVEKTETEGTVITQ